MDLFELATSLLFQFQEAYATPPPPMERAAWEVSFIYLRHVNPATIHQGHSDTCPTLRPRAGCDIKIKWTQLPIINKVSI